MKTFKPATKLNYSLNPDLIRNLFLVAVVLLSIILSNHRINATQLDVFDEGAHLDYVITLAKGTPPSWDSKLQQRTLKIVDCGGRSNVDALPCIDKVRVPEMYGAGGYSYQAQQPPLGYILHVIFAKIYSHEAEINYLKSIRSSGYIWTIIAGLLILYISHKSKFNSLQGLIFGTTCLLAPAYINSAGTVTNDSTGLIIGLISMIMLGRIKKFKPSVFFVLGLIIGLTKIIFIIPIIGMGAAVFWSKKTSVHDSNNKNRKIIPIVGDLDKKIDYKDVNFKNIISVICGAIFSALVWIIIQDLRSETESITVQKALFGFISESRPRMNTIIGSIYTNLNVLNSYSPNVWFAFLTLFAIGAVLANFIYSKNDTYANFFSIVFAVTSIVMAFFWNLSMNLLTHFDIGTAARYMIVSLPYMSMVLVRTPRLFQYAIAVCTLVGSYIWLVTPIF